MGGDLAKTLPFADKSTVHFPSPGAEASSNSAIERGRRWRSPLLLALISLALLLPFINKPLHIDDPMYVWAAQQIRREPFNPYGFDVNWSGVISPMPEEMKNPPGGCYYLALASLLVGWDPRGLHAAMLLPALGVILGVYFLARELGCRHAFLAAMLTLLTPLFLVSATSLMCDVPMLCCYIWAVWFWVRGIRQRRTGLLIASAVLVACSSLTKYFGITLFPLLIAYALIQRRGMGAWLWPLLIPAVVLGAYEVWTKHLYGSGLLLEAMIYASSKQQLTGTPLPLRLLAGFSFMGGGCLTIALMLITRARLWMMAGGAIALLGIAAALLWIDPFPRFPIHRSGGGGVDAAYLAQLSVFVTAGLAIGAVALAHARRLRDADAMLLLFWIAGTYVFATVFNWSVNGRSILPLAPAAGILVGGLVDRAAIGIKPAIWRRWGVVFVLVIGGVLSLLCTIADFTHASEVRSAADFLCSKFSAGSRRIWFVGHWGFQYYMEQHGAYAIDPNIPAWKPGDVIMTPLNNSYPYIFLGNAKGDLPTIHIGSGPVLPFLGLMDRAVHAGFYTDLWGPLPYGYGPVPRDRYVVQEIRGPIHPQHV
jgi:hypothetical protein